MCLLLCVSYLLTIIILFQSLHAFLVACHFGLNLCYVITVYSFYGKINMMMMMMMMMMHECEVD